LCILLLSERIVCGFGGRMDAVWWICTVALMLVGLAGTVLPLIPGAALILCGAVLNSFTVGAVGWPTLVGLTLLMILAQALDVVSGAMGAKWFGATRWGAIGGILGAVVGLFFGLIGIFIGPLVGALAGELLGGQGILPAGRSTWGTFVGTTAGIVGKFAIGVVMIGWFGVAALS
jgi:uncharacterized protein YqgC (DUF456 family)